MPEAADRALVSVATAYRYFSSAEDLWWEASNEAFGDQGTLAEAEQRVEAAGSDPQARLEALIRSVGFDAPDSERIPIRQGRRNEQIRRVIDPLHGRLPKKDLDRIAHALGLVVGTEAMVALTDAVGLDVPATKKTLLDAGRWLLAGALAELTDAHTQ